MEKDFYCESEPYFDCVEQGVRGFIYRDYEIAPHAHSFYEINIVQAGKGTHIIEERRFPVREGNVFVIPPETVHAYENEGGLEVYHLVLHAHFLDEYIPERQKVSGMSLLTEIEPFLRKNGAPYFLRLTKSQLLALQNDLLVITDGSEYDYEGSYELKRYTVLKILYYWAHLLQEQTYKRSVPIEQETVVMRALDYIHNNYAEKITVKTLCAYTYTSRSTFLRQFESVCGCTPIAYVRAYRIKRARELLSEGKIGKTEIAHACGFYDLSHMNRELRTAQA